MKNEDLRKQCVLNLGFIFFKPVSLGFPCGSDGKESDCNVGDLGLIPRLGRAPGGGHGNPFQYSLVEKPMDRGAWRAAAHGVAKSRTRLSDYAQQSTCFFREKQNPKKLGGHTQTMHSGGLWGESFFFYLLRSLLSALLE